MGNKNSEKNFLKMAEKYLAPNYEPIPVVIEGSRGSWVWDIKGRAYLDMLSCYSALNLGHGHPRIIKALKNQAEKLAVFPRKFLSEELILFAKELAEFCGQEMVLPVNSGVEAVETAIKLARSWGYAVKGIPKNQAQIIVCNNNFHGRTVTVIGFSSESAYRDPFGPFTPGFQSIPFGDIKALKKAITPNTAAFLVEPIQGEGGIVVPPDGYLGECFEICRQADVLFMADEVQTGFCRTGKIFACDWDGVKPDVLILGKALGGGGLGISAVVSSRSIMSSAFKPGSHGSTFGGNPLACRVAREVLKIIGKGYLANKSKMFGEYFKANFSDFSCSKIKEVRGRGLLIGIELYQNGLNAHEICKKLLDQGVICSDTRKYVIRVAPPLTITFEELEFGIRVITKTLR